MTQPHFNTKHGAAGRGKKTKTYRTWESMHRRCYLPSQDSYKDYGGKGVGISYAWHKFENFVRDMGEQPETLTLDRKNPLLGYSAENCRWATLTEQARNKSTTRWLDYAGEKLCLAEWAERINVKPKTLRARLDDYGWSVERALTTPLGAPRQTKGKP